MVRWGGPVEALRRGDVVMWDCSLCRAADLKTMEPSDSARDTMMACQPPHQGRTPSQQGGTWQATSELCAVGIWGPAGAKVGLHMVRMWSLVEAKAGLSCGNPVTGRQSPHWGNTSLLASLSLMVCSPHCLTGTMSIMMGKQREVQVSVYH